MIKYPGCRAEFSDCDGPVHKYFGESAACWKAGGELLTRAISAIKKMHSYDNLSNRSQLINFRGAAMRRQIFLMLSLLLGIFFMTNCKFRKSDSDLLADESLPINSSAYILSISEGVRFSDDDRKFVLAELSKGLERLTEAHKTKNYMPASTALSFGSHGYYDMAERGLELNDQALDKLRIFISENLENEFLLIAIETLTKIESSRIYWGVSENGRLFRGRLENPELRAKLYSEAWSNEKIDLRETFKVLVTVIKSPKTSDEIKKVTKQSIKQELLGGNPNQESVLADLLK